jgi:hypothetical protein
MVLICQNHPSTLNASIHRDAVSKESMRNQLNKLSLEQIN